MLYSPENYVRKMYFWLHIAPSDVFTGVLC